MENVKLSLHVKDNINFPKSLPGVLFCGPLQGHHIQTLPLYHLFHLIIYVSGQRKSINLWTLINLRYTHTVNIIKPVYFLNYYS